MIKDKDKTKEQLIGELAEIRRRVAELETAATERNGSGTALQESEAWCKELIDNTNDIIYTHDLEGNFTWVNPAVTQIFGYDPKGNPEVNIAQVVDPEYLPLTRQNIREKLEGAPQTEPYELLTYSKTGEPIWVEVSTRLLKDRQPVQVLGIARDITKRKQTEESLRESEERFARLSEAAFEGIAISEKGIVLDVNGTLVKMLGYEPAEIIGMEVMDFVAPESRELVRQHIRSGHEAPYEHMALRKDGSTFPVEVQGKFIPFKGRKLRVTAIRDITSRKETQEKLRRRNRELILLNQAIEQTTESVVITDTQGTILYVNPAFEHLTGYSQAEAIGQNPSLLKSGRQDDTFYRELWATISAGKVWRGRFVNKKKDGTLFTEDAAITPVYDENRTIVNYIALKRDITQELRLEEQYHQAQKMEAIGQLASGVAHDFNNLLTSIMGYVGLVLRQLPPDEPVRSDIEGIQKTAERAANLTHQLLAFSRKQVIQPEVLSLNTVVADVEKMLGRLIGDDIDLMTILGPTDSRIKADRGQLEQVIVNLVVNARDAMPGGGKLIIETAAVELDKTYARQHLNIQPGSYMMLAVSDTGVGIDEKTRARIFEPFFTTKAQGKGTGLGLATVYGIVKQNGGNIWVYSEQGQGTTFKVYLPCVEAGVVSRYSQADRLNGKMPHGTETVLLVEDNPAVRELIARTLQVQGYTILEAANGAEALRLLGEHTGAIHLLLTDVVMPEMDGKSLADRLKEMRADTQVIFMSGYTDEAIVHHGVLETGVAFIQKPFAPADLTRKIREALDSQASATDKFTVSHRIQ